MSVVALFCCGIFERFDRGMYTSLLPVVIVFIIKIMACDDPAIHYSHALSLCCRF